MRRYGILCVTACIAPLIAIVLSPVEWVSIADGRSVPLLSADGYHFLTAAEYILREPLTFSALFHAPLLSAITAVISWGGGLPVAIVAPFIPSLIAFIFLICLGRYFSFLVSLPAAALGSLCCGLFPLFLSRAVPGWFDTDALVMLVLSILGLATWKGITRVSLRYRSVVLGVLAQLCLFWTWQKAGVVGIAFVCAVLLPCCKLEWKKFAFLGAIFAVGLLCVPEIRGWIVRHAALLFSTPFEDVAGIAELQPLSIGQVGEMLPGGWIAWAAVCFGIAFLGVRRPVATAALVFPWVGLALLSFVSVRFAIFLSPVIGVGAAGCIDCVIFFAEKKCMLSRGRAAVFGGAVGAVWGLFFVIHLTAHFTPHSLFTKNDVNMIARLVPFAQQHETLPIVWAWWDTGYFVRNISGLRVFADGGSQSEENVLILQRIFSTQNPELARNLLHFFTHHGTAGIRGIPTPLTRKEFAQTRRLRERLDWICRLLEDRQKASALLVQHSLSPKKWLPYLFPQNIEPVLVYLDEGLFRRTWWCKAADPLQPYPPVFLDIVDTNDEFDSVVPSTISYGGDMLPISFVVDRHKDRVQIQMTQHRHGHVVLRKKTGMLVMPSFAAKSLVGRLLLFGGAPGFHPLARDIGVGGVWQVL